MFEYRGLRLHLVDSLLLLLDFSMYKEISEPNREANKQKKKGGGGRAFRLGSLCTMKRRWRRASTGIFFNGPWPRYSRSGDTCQIIIERFPRYYRKRSDVLLYIATRVARDPMIDRYGGATSISPCY